MIRSLPRSKTYDWSFNAFIILYFVFLFAPLVVTCVLAFNNSDFPSLPWQGFSLDWFGRRPGPDRPVSRRAEPALHRDQLRDGLFRVHPERGGRHLRELPVREGGVPLQGLLYMLMLAPLVIPGVILGISQLLAANTAGTFVDETFGVDIPFFRPSFWLVVLGQFSFITTFVTLVVSARLRKFDPSLEEAALNLGATHFGVIRHVTLKFLRPAIVGAGAVAFLMSFENFNTTLFLVGSEPTLPINLYLQVRDGSTPVINAVSLMLIVGTSLLALINFYFTRKTD